MITTNGINHKKYTHKQWNSIYLNCELFYSCNLLVWVVGWQLGWGGASGAGRTERGGRYPVAGQATDTVGMATVQGWWAGTGGVVRIGGPSVVAGSWLAPQSSVWDKYKYKSII